MTRFKEILVDAGVMAENSLKGVISGHHYNRSLRCHKLIFDALMRLQIQDFFFNSLNDSQKQDTTSVLQDLEKSFPEHFIDFVNPNYFVELLDNFEAHVKKRSLKMSCMHFGTVTLK